LTAGSHTITTSYPGDGNFSGSMGALAAAQVVAVKTTTTSIASSLNPSTAGQAVTFTATVTTTGGGGAPTGTVTFNDGGGTLGTGTLAGGIASFTTSSLAVGSHSITAAFNGAGSFGQSTSAVLTQAVGTSTDSLKLRALQVAVTKLESQGSGQAISGVIDGAIADGFEPSNNPISATDNGLHFNFAAEPKEQTSPAKEGIRGTSRRQVTCRQASPLRRAEGVACLGRYPRQQLEHRIANRRHQGRTNQRDCRDHPQAYA
jgi:Bacterial Ig-like domain (group 3)